MDRDSRTRPTEQTPVDHEPSWQRQLLIGLSVLLAIGILIGAVLAVIAVKTADYVGLGGDRSTSSPAPILPTTGDATKTAPPPTRHTPPTTPATHRRHHTITITLTARPDTAGSYQQVNLTGGYPGHDGVTLQVQRSLGKGPWSDFPTSTSVNGGTYATYIKTGLIGVNHFRMLDKATGKSSNIVTVTIG